MQQMCDDAGFMSMAVTFAIAGGSMLLGVLIGYLLGKRKAIIEALRKMADATQLKKDLDKAKSDMKEDDEEDNEDDRLQEAQDLLVSFLSNDSVPGLDDNSNMFVNPIMLYDIRRQEEQKRQARSIEKLLSDKVADGTFDQFYIDSLTPTERQALGEKLIRAEGTSGSAAGIGSVDGFRRTHGANKNSMAILVSMGLKTASERNVGQEDAEANAAAAIREKLKTIEKHLASDDFDVSRSPAKKGTNLRISNALQMAHLTKAEPVKEVNEVLRYEERLDFAQRGRKRVAPPLDHQTPSLNQRLYEGNKHRRQSMADGGRRQSMAGRRASLSNGLPQFGAPAPGGPGGLRQQQMASATTVYNAKDFTI